MTDTSLRIKRIEVKKLFNLHDHIINLNLDDNITILHGPNGVGKTVILFMINALFSGRFGYFSSIPFQEFRVVLTNDYEIILSEEMNDSSLKKIYLSLNDGKKIWGRNQLLILILLH
ncbi:MAG: ATP-binding protein [Thioploca sp.]|nr:ATP-binding protein [Thioploca sp.]